MKMKILIGLLLACFVIAASAQDANTTSTPAVAQSSKPFAAVDDLLFAGDFQESLLEGSFIYYPQWEDVNSHTQAALKELDAKLDPALQQAKADPQILAATKAFYIAAQDYFTNVWPSPTVPYAVVQANKARLKADLDAKSSELKLDLKLATQ